MTMAKARTSSKKRRRVEEDDEPRRRRRRAPEPEDYLPEDDDFDAEDDADFDEEEEEDEAPRRRRRPSRDRDEDDGPRRRRRLRDEDEDDDLDEEDDDDLDEEDDDEDEDDEPRRRRPAKGKGKKKSRSRAEDDISIEGGWGEFKKEKEKGSKYPDRWKPEDEPTVVRFMEDEPYASYRQHWFNELKGNKTHRMGYICLDKGCPACDLLGDSPGMHTLFNVVVFDLATGEAELKSLDAGSKLGNAIEQHAFSDRTGPLTAHYYAISASGSGGSYSAQVQVIKERDLEEDWDIVPLDDDELDEFEENLFDAKSVDRPNPKALDDAVDFLLNDVAYGDDDDDDDDYSEPRSRRRSSSSSRRGGGGRSRRRR